MMYSEYMENEMATHFSILAWIISWTGLVGYNPWGHKEPDMIKWLTLLYFTLLLSQISSVTIYSLDVPLSRFETSPLFHVWF